ncbi:MAG: SoxR reducing system RseC family protein [Nitrospirae bacterium]|nr:SoxR reducing system RseC family protein [Nitrospirota bacterium]
MLQSIVMEETGVVKSIDGVTATVLVQKTKTCEGCKESQSCGIAGNGEDQSQTVEIAALNIAGARVGQTVRVVAKSYTYVKGTLLVYGLPAVALLLGAIAGKYMLADMFKSSNPEILSAFGGFSAFLVSFIILKLISRRLERKTENTPVIEHIIEQ